VSLLAEQVPEDRGRALGNDLQTHLGGSGLQLLIGGADHGDPGQVALHVCGEDRHAGVRQALSQDLQGDRLARAGGAGHQAMAVGPVQPEEQRLLAPQPH